MAETQEKQTESQGRSRPTGGARRKSGRPHVQGGGPSPQGEEDALGERLDQIGSLLSKGFDLLEAGITLGISLATRLSSALRVEAGDYQGDRGYPEGGPPPYQGSPGAPSPYHASPRMGPQTGMQQAGQFPGTVPPDRPLPGWGPPAPESSAQAPAPPVTYVMNRQPLLPGSAVQVSFTINNDSASVPRDLRLRVEGFAGEMGGAQLDGATFAVEPESKVIAPLDFDKFTLQGTIPADAPADVYGGWIVVAAEEELRIPVRLVVTAGQ